MSAPMGEWAVDDWRLRVEQGRKGPNDRKIWVASRGGSLSLMRLSTVGAITRLWCANEELLYPEEWQEGGERVLRFLSDCGRGMPLREACVNHKLRPPIIRKVPNV